MNLPNGEPAPEHMSSNWLPNWTSRAAPRRAPPPPPPPPTSGTSPEPSPKKPRTEADSSSDRKSPRSLSATLAPSNWLAWRTSGRGDTDDDADSGRPDDGDDNGEIDENENDEAINDDDEDHEDEVDDHVAHDRAKSGSSWNFWSRDGVKDDDKSDKPPDSKQPEKPDSKDKKPKDRLANATNRILNTTPAFPKDEEAPEDDAVLYKPHNQPQEFQKINTHKNENLKENVIVPEWDECLPSQSSTYLSGGVPSFLGNSSTSNQSNKMDLTNWRQFLGQLSTRLGFSSQSLTSVVTGEAPPESEDNSSASKDTVEKEFNLLYERTYHLYGKCLAKLPESKRGCLPSYNKYYTSPADGDAYVYDQQTQLEEDAADPNSISITNDPMGNLLINHRPQTASGRPAPAINADIVSQRTGPLIKIKKILVIGVHGFFPTRMIRPLIGAPKGTSLKFATEAEKAIIRYCVDNGFINEDDSNDLSVQKIALEKEGKIFDRVSFFTEILIKWQQELNEADFIFVAAHSQGCVVSIILLANLIKLGILKDPIRKRIGILGMAGINNGPFYGVDKSFFMKAYSAIEHDSLMELFELSKFDSEQSLVYKESMQVIINANIKLCFIGSINDQLVPLYSALASHLYHPNIYRACYIDHASQTPLFIQKLVSLCCHLMNLGFFDNNVLKELSTALAGPLTGGGHSKIYNDGKVYDMGVKFILNTDDIVIPPTELSKLSHRSTKPPPDISKPVNGAVTSGIGAYGNVPASTGSQEVVKLPVTNQVYIKEFNISKIGTNPFILPWCLRGLLFNIEKNWPNNNKLLSVDNGRAVGKTGYDEIQELYEHFDTWKPESKVLKELKFRLNGLRASKL